MRPALARGHCASKEKPSKGSLLLGQCQKHKANCGLNNATVVAASCPHLCSPQPHSKKGACAGEFVFFRAGIWNYSNQSAALTPNWAACFYAGVANQSTVLTPNYCNCWHIRHQRPLLHDAHQAENAATSSIMLMNHAVNAGRSHEELPPFMKIWQSEA